MKTGVANRLAVARARLDELGRLTTDLVSAHPTILEDPELRERFAAFERAHREAQARLSKPTLSIAMIGTTSSGKSTIVNALIGRRIAPIEAGEMSAGVLTLRHGQAKRLVVDDAEGAPWTAGTWVDLNDADTYDRVRDGVMRPYHEARRSRACLAPQVLVEGPLLPCVDATLLGLPPDLDVEFIDLPGLKSVQDRANLAVIQTRVHKAFCLVALDYLQTDEEHRKKLLEELSRIVQYLQGRPDSMVFVLNRVDQRGEDDEPIGARVTALKREIKEVLRLRSEPHVLPFEARLLYRAQCAWGAADGRDAVTALDVRREHLRTLFGECASSLKRREREHPELRAWLRDVADRVDDGETPSTDDLRKLLGYAREWSGGEGLWRLLRARIEASFPELVILPSLIEVLDAHKNLTDALRAVSSIRKIDSKEQLKRERERLDAVRLRLHEVGATRERFRNRLTTVAEGLKTGDQTVRHRLTKELGPGFEALLGAVNEVTGDLMKSLIAPIRDALKTSRGVHDLEEQLRDVLEPPVAKDLTHAYDLFSRRIPTLSRANAALTVRVREDDPAAVKRVEETERDLRRLYYAMRESMAARAQFTLQGQAASIRGALAGLLEEQANAIANTLRANLPDLAIDHAIESARRAQTRDDLLALPEQFFTLPTPVEQRRQERTEVVDRRQEVEHYTTGTCFKDKKTRTVIRDVTGPVAYQELALPDEDEMARRWSDGVQATEHSLWEALRTWMADALDESSVKFSASIGAVLGLVDRALVQQEQLAADESNAVVEFWETLDLTIDRIEIAWAAVGSTATSDGGRDA